MSNFVKGKFNVATVLTACGIETGTIRPITPEIVRVATVLTACGIETIANSPTAINFFSCNSTYRLRYWNAVIIYSSPSNSCVLQQYLPLAVLKRNCSILNNTVLISTVATVLTACGIETQTLLNKRMWCLNVATVLTACGIETIAESSSLARLISSVVTVLTACGIETLLHIALIV